MPFRGGETCPRFTGTHLKDDKMTWMYDPTLYILSPSDARVSIWMMKDSRGVLTIWSNYMTIIPTLDSTPYANSNILQSAPSQVCILHSTPYLDSALCHFRLYGPYTRLLPCASPWLETIRTLPCIHGNVLHHVNGPNYA